MGEQSNRVLTRSVHNRSSSIICTSSVSPSFRRKVCPVVTSVCTFWEYMRVVPR